jgi:hypothetical protein
MLRFWMPDQVRHDEQELSDFLKYDTVCKGEEKSGSFNRNDGAATWKNIK